jgi:predicted dehydrogenase
MLRFVLVGSSGFAARSPAPALVRSEVAGLHGVVGSTQAKAAALVGEVGTGIAYESLDAALADPDVDAVWVAASDVHHVPMGLRVLAAGKHLLVEKPIATNLAEARVLVDAAADSDCVLRVGTHQRFRRAYQDIKRTLPELGQLVFVKQSFYVPKARGEVEDWRATVAESGGSWALKEYGAHLLDMLLWWTGSPARVVGAHLATRKHDVETEDSATVLLQLADGSAGVVSVSAAVAVDGLSTSVELWGTDGWLRAEDIWRGGGRIERSKGERVDYPGDDPVEPYLCQLEDFASAVAGGGSIGADGEAGLAVMELIDEALALCSQPSASL